jgi:hypothetical protein
MQATTGHYRPLRAVPAIAGPSAAPQFRVRHSRTGHHSIHCYATLLHGIARGSWWRTAPPRDIVRQCPRRLDGSLGLEKDCFVALQLAGKLVVACCVCPQNTNEHLRRAHIFPQAVGQGVFGVRPASFLHGFARLRRSETIPPGHCWLAYTSILQAMPSKSPRHISLRLHAKPREEKTRILLGARACLVQSVVRVGHGPCLVSWRRGRPPPQKKMP